MYEKVIKFGIGPGDPDGIAFLVLYDWDLSPSGKVWLGIMEIQHKGENILELISMDRIEELSEYIAYFMRKQPPSPEAKLLHDTDPLVVQRRLELAEYAAVMSDNNNRIREALEESQFPFIAARIPNQTEH